MCTKNGDWKTRYRAEEAIRRREDAVQQTATRLYNELFELTEHGRREGVAVMIPVTGEIRELSAKMDRLCAEIEAMQEMKRIYAE